MAWPERVAVVGGGPAGLAAAYELARAGRGVTVYEARGTPGGRMRSDAMEGASVDVAVQLLSSTYATLLNIADEVGAAGRIVRAPGRDALWRKGSAHGITYGSVSSMITSSALPTSLKLKLAAKYLPFLGKEARGLDANDPLGSGGASLDEESIAEWGHRQLGEDFVELLAYPLLAAYYGGPPENTSAALYHALAKVGLDVRVMAARGGMGALAADLGEALRSRGVAWRFDTRVERIEPGPAGVDVVSRAVVRADAGAAGVDVVGDAVDRFDAAIVAVPAPTVPDLMQPSPALAAWLEGVHVAPTTTLALLIDGRPRADFFGLSFPRREPPGDTLVALCVQSRKVDGLAPEGREVLVAFPSPRLAPDLMKAAPRDVVDALMPAVEQAIPGSRERVLRARVHRFPEGYTLFRPGYLRHLQGFQPAWLPRGVALAGDYLVAPTVEGAMISGRRAASSLLTSDSPADPG